MTDPSATPPVWARSNAGIPPGRTLRRLFLTLFLRGRTSRGLQKETAPRSIGQKLPLTLCIYALLGLLALTFRGKPLFMLSVYLHAMTFVFLGMSVAASAGEMLFNKEEADILLHRPITPRALLWAKVGVLVQVSLWLAGAFNLAGFFVGIGSSPAGWLFPFAHALSTALEALFCTGCVVLVYQLCLRWFGRERLDNLMTAAQVLVAMAAILAGQLVPQLMLMFGGTLNLQLRSWWVFLLPPAWFAGQDNLLTGHGATSTWILATAGLAATAAVVGLAFGSLARDYETGLRNLNESSGSPPTRQAGKRWIEALVTMPPLRWWLRDPVERAAFMLTIAYLFRDRDVKLRVYPGLAPMLVLPLLFLFQDRGQPAEAGGMALAFTGSFLGLMPLLVLNLLRYSQQWQAADLFRVAPLAGPAPLCHGARRAVLCVLTLPVLLLFGLMAWLLHPVRSQLALALPGLLALPLYALIPCAGGKAVPLSLPTEEAKSTNRGLQMAGVMVVSMLLSFLATWAWTNGWFKELLLAEAVLVAILYVELRISLKSTRWPPLE